MMVIVVFDIIKSSLKNLTRKKISSMLTIVGISIGVASVILVGNISNCGSSAIYKEMDSLGLGGLTISKNDSLSTNMGFTDEDLNLVKQVEHIKQVMPLTVKNGKIFCRNENKDSILWGVDNKANQIISLKVIYGRGITNSDVEAKNNICLVDESFAKKFYNRDNIVGKKIYISYDNFSDEFEIVGIIKAGSGILENIVGTYIPNFVYMPYTSLNSGEISEKFNQIAVKIEDGCDVEVVGKDVVGTLERINGRKDYIANDLSKQKEGLNKLLNIITLVLSAVGAISLIVASLSIMTIMLVSVNERTREIGIKKSIGAKRKTIMLEFLFEAVFMSLIGCIIGILSSSLISFIGIKLLNFELQLNFNVIILASVFSMLSSVIFGLYPAAKASKLRPEEVLTER